MINSTFTRQFGARSIPVACRKSLPIAAILITMTLAGCASTGPGKIAGLSDPNTPFMPIQKNAPPVDKAVQYWSQAFAKNPGNEKAAVALARNLRAKGEKQKALQVLRRASIANSSSREIASEYARLAVDMGQHKMAKKLIRRATDPGRPDWRLISAQGTSLAKQGKHKESQGFFLRALQLKPAHPPLLNNLALAYALNGDIGEAETLLRKAATKGQNIRKIRQNLALVLGVQGKFGESQNVANTVTLDEGRARTDTEFLKRWVKADPQSAPSAFPIQTASVQAPAAPLRGSARPTDIKPWATQIKSADASTWVTEVADGQ